MRGVSMMRKFVATIAGAVLAGGLLVASPPAAEAARPLVVPCVKWMPGTARTACPAKHLRWVTARTTYQGKFYLRGGWAPVR